VISCITPFLVIIILDIGQKESAPGKQLPDILAADYQRHFIHLLMSYALETFLPQLHRGGSAATVLPPVPLSASP